jgi:predicted DsbA family dithiol-disulfide isomerase
VPLGKDGGMSVTMWFDPTCPFTWRTSRWLRETAARRGETVRWRFISLAILNEGREVPEQYRAGMAWGRTVHRALAAADKRYGQEAVDRLYTAIGERIHDQGADRDAATLSDAVAAAGLPPEIAEAAQDSTWDSDVRASHDEAQARVGTESGSPITAFGDGPAHFGPVVVPIPRDDEADRLFDAMLLLSGVPAFSELRRARNPF